MKKEDIERAWQDPRIKDLMNPIVAFLKSEVYIKVSARGIRGEHFIWFTPVGDTMGGSTRHESLTIKSRYRTLYEEGYDWQGHSRIVHLSIKGIGRYSHLLVGLREEYEKIWKEVEDSRRESLFREEQRGERNIKEKIDEAFGRVNK